MLNKDISSKGESKYTSFFSWAFTVFCFHLLSFLNFKHSSSFHRYLPFCSISFRVALARLSSFHPVSFIFYLPSSFSILSSSMPKAKWLTSANQKCKAWSHWLLPRDPGAGKATERSEWEKKKKRKRQRWKQRRDKEIQTWPRLSRLFAPLGHLAVKWSFTAKTMTCPNVFVSHTWWRLRMNSKYLRLVSAHVLPKTMFTVHQKWPKRGPYLNNATAGPLFKGIEDRGRNSVLRQRGVGWIGGIESVNVSFATSVFVLLLFNDRAVNCVKSVRCWLKCVLSTVY